MALKKEIDGRPRARLAFIVLGVAFCVCLIWAVLMSFIAASSGHHVLSLQDQLEDTRRNITKLEKEAKVCLQAAQEEADKILLSAKALKEEAREILIRDQQRMYEVYGSIYEYNSGQNLINQRYLHSFTLTGTRISVRMINNSKKSVKPDFKILFLNHYGFISDTYSDAWLFSRIKPGETRLSEGIVSFKFGEPIYYALFFQ